MSTRACHLASFFTPVPFFLSEYFGHCHVLLGTFEKVSESLYYRVTHCMPFASFL